MAKKRRSDTRSARMVECDEPKKGRPRLWAYGYVTLARVLGMNAVAVRQAVKRKAFDPAQLESIIAYAIARRGRRGKTSTTSSA